MGFSLSNGTHLRLSPRRLALLGFLILVSLCLLVFSRATSLHNVRAYASSGVGSLTSSNSPVHVAGPDFGPRYDARLEARSVAAAGNETLGFHEIRYINMPGRYDRSDAAVLQAYITGLKLTEQTGVTPEQIPEKGRPPTERPGRLSDGEVGCWRAHANIWADMLRDRTGPILILESDAIWDHNTRQIAARANREFVKFLSKINSIPQRSSFWPEHVPGSAASSQIQHDPSDPWLSTHWDMLQLGTCGEGTENENIFMTWPDEDVNPGFEDGPLRLQRERAVRVSGGPVCTTAYAVSQRGAAKLLVRTAMNLDEPVDYVMRKMVIARELLSYDILPVMFAQWAYKENLGVTHRTSDINPDLRRRRDEAAEAISPPKTAAEGEEKPSKDDQDKMDYERQKEKLKGWREALNTKTVWRVKPGQTEWAWFKEPTLKTAYKRIFSDEDLGLKKWEDAVAGRAPHRPQRG